MSRIALVTHDVQTVQGRAGGVGAFVTHFGTLLKEAGEDVTIILARANTESLEVDQIWRERYRSWGIQLIELHNTVPRPDRWSDAWPLRLSEQVAPLLSSFDVVYFSDWANLGFLPVRQKRFATNPKPSLITVLHGPSGWVRTANRQYPRLPEDLHVDFIERYSALHSDAVIAPSRFIVDWLKREGWRFRSEPEVLGLPYRPGAGAARAKTPETLTRLIFFGRLEVLKGFALFVDAVRKLNAESPVLSRLQEIVILGPEDEQSVTDQTRRELEATGVPITHIRNLDSWGARDYLAGHAGDALVVIPSPVENFPYTVIEAGCIPGLNLICSRGGGIPEVFQGDVEAQMFDAHPASLAAKIEERLQAPLQLEELAQYDYASANRRWLEFHRRICETQVRPHRPARASVDVCVTYYNKPRYLPQLLETLELQTQPGFGVITVDDGSPDPEARAVFDALAERYASRGWIFFRQPNAFVDAARNRAAQRSTADYLVFIDADDLPAPNAIQRLTEAALLSGCDCLLTYGCLFEGDQSPCDPSSGQVLAPIQARYLPLGPDLVGGLVDPIVFGPPMILIRRSVFEALGGYREVRGAAHEDWELQLRLLLANYQTDVLPEYLLFFRRLPDGLANCSDDFAAKRRLLETYEAHLAKSGLNGVATALAALHRRCQELESVVRQNVPLDLRLRLQDRLRTLLNQPPRP